MVNFWLYLFIIERKMGKCRWRNVKFYNFKSFFNIVINSFNIKLEVFVRMFLNYCGFYLLLVLVFKYNIYFLLLFIFLNIG